MEVDPWKRRSRLWPRGASGGDARHCSAASGEDGGGICTASASSYGRTL